MSRDWTADVTGEPVHNITICDNMVIGNIKYTMTISLRLVVL